MPSVGKPFNPKTDHLEKDHRIRMGGKNKFTQEERRIRDSSKWHSRLISRKHYSKSKILDIMQQTGRDSIQSKNITPEFIETYNKLIQQASIDNIQNKKKYPWAIQRFFKAKTVVNLTEHKQTLESCKSTLKKHQAKPNPQQKPIENTLPLPATPKPEGYIDWADLADPNDPLLSCIGEAFNIYDIHQFLGCINKDLKISQADGTAKNWKMVMQTLKLEQVKDVMHFETETQFRQFLHDNSARFTKDIHEKCSFSKLELA